MNKHVLLKYTKNLLSLSEYIYIRIVISCAHSEFIYSDIITTSSVS